MRGLRYKSTAPENPFTFDASDWQYFTYTSSLRRLPQSGNEENETICAKAAMTGRNIYKFSNELIV